MIDQTGEDRQLRTVKKTKVSKMLPSFCHEQPWRWWGHLWTREHYRKSTVMRDLKFNRRPCGRWYLPKVLMRSLIPPALFGQCYFDNLPLRNRVCVPFSWTQGGFVITEEAMPWLLKLDRKRPHTWSPKPPGKSQPGGLRACGGLSSQWRDPHREAPQTIALAGASAHIQQQLGTMCVHHLEGEASSCSQAEKSHPCQTCSNCQLVCKRNDYCLRHCLLEWFL